MRPIVQEAVAKTNKLLQNDRFYENVTRHSQFDLATISPAEIALLMRITPIKMEVDLYYAVSPVKNIDQYDDDTNPHIIHMNIWKLERPVASICNTLLHSCVHAVNARYSKYYFGHGDNSLVGKENTAPYLIGSLAEKMLDGHKIYNVPLEHDVIMPGTRVIKDHLRAYA